ncbi:hypothetical protein TNCV_1509671 [Trichonephila clavipes]|nr:hypothetical protein TNCV_1509671 [Trichonephila clavipes]
MLYLHRALAGSKLLGSKSAFVFVNSRTPRDVVRFFEALVPNAKVGPGFLNRCRPTYYPDTGTNNNPKQINVYDLQWHRPARPTAAF